MVRLLLALLGLDAISHEDDGLCQLVKVWLVAEVGGSGEVVDLVLPALAGCERVSPERFVRANRVDTGGRCRAVNRLEDANLSEGGIACVEDDLVFSSVACSDLSLWEDLLRGGGNATPCVGGSGLLPVSGSTQKPVNVPSHVPRRSRDTALTFWLNFQRQNHRSHKPNATVTTVTATE